MPNNVAHVILTRFNVPTKGREARVRMRPAWLAHRFELFERFCLPTIAAQTQQAFLWLMYFDRETPPEFKRRIDTYRHHSFFRPRFVTLEDMDHLPQHISDLFPDKPKWLLTTHLDNDDGLHRDFAANLYKALTFDGPQVINFDEGLIYREGALYQRTDTNNPFASFLEPFGTEVRTIWGEQHIHLDRLGPVHGLKCEPMWLQVVHGSNVSNRIRGSRIPRRNALQGFPIKEAADIHESDWDVKWDRLALSPYRAGRDAGIKVYKFFRSKWRGDGPL